VIGELKETVPAFLQTVPDAAPIGFRLCDVDYYSSTRDALALFDGRPAQYLPRTLVYLDDLEHPSHNSGAASAARCSIQRGPRAAQDRAACLSAELPDFPQRALDRSHVHPARARSSDRTTLVQERQATILTNPYLE